MRSMKKTSQPGNTSIFSLVIIKVQEVSEDLTPTEEDQASLKTNRFVHFPSPKYNENLKDVTLIFTNRRRKPSQLVTRHQSKKNLI